MQKVNNKKTVYIAMSGGVDSSVAALLLKKKGFQIVGVFMKPWQPKLSDANRLLQTTCMWQKEREDALRVATAIGMPLLTWDFSREYERHVARYMIDSYRRGFTPNPDIMCNKHIKFGFFLKRAISSGADYIATGHYARLRREFPISNFQFPRKKPKTSYTLRTARDKNKDQTYFLWMLGARELSRTLFPIGDYTKPQVRAIARKARLPVAEKKDSQGVCFVGPMSVRDFLLHTLKPRKGEIILKDKSVIGSHLGAFQFTIGQRHGLDIKDGKGPYYVLSTDIRKNSVTVGCEKDLYSSEAKVTGMRFFGNKPKFPICLGVKIRYRAPTTRAALYKSGKIEFSHPQRAVAPGQSSVFYDRDRVIGGGIIAKKNR